MKGLEKALGSEPSNLQYRFTHIFLQLLELVWVKEWLLGTVGRGITNQHDLVHFLGLGMGAAFSLTSRPVFPWAWIFKILLCEFYFWVYNTFHWTSNNYWGEGSFLFHSWTVKVLRYLLSQVNEHMGTHSLHCFLISGSIGPCGFFSPHVHTSVSVNLGKKWKT